MRGTSRNRVPSGRRIILAILHAFGPIRNQCQRCYTRIAARVRACLNDGRADRKSREMRVCVTGGTGLIGGALVRRLLAEGAQVRVLARPSQRADELEARGAEAVRGDLSDPEAIERAVREAEVVYHAAAKIDPPGTRAEFFETNVGGTERVL